MKQRVQAAPPAPTPQVVVPARNRVFRKCACDTDERIQRRALPGFDHANALPVSQPHDPAERDADRLADSALRSTPSHEIARATSPRGSGGEPLGRDVRAFFEPRFGRDLGDVRVHADASAARAARAFHAEAFTIGGDVHFGTGAYAPGSERGRKLIAHELAHVVHKWPLFLGGPDATPNFVFLDNARHTGWHDLLHAQGKYGWMTFDPVGTRYCVY